ncbi:MAG: hypothetical protein HOV66_28545, partial [Streptomycetaceae bacterium]|nr:hypothetical protein [Streptomycetaceae bacterium]
RFADLLGPPAEAALRAAADAEAAARPGRITAELVYLPRRARSANVVIRPLVRDREIVVGTTPGGECTIPPDELVVGLHEGRFTVRWPAHDAEVVPCSGHMLTSSQAPPVVRLLDGRPQLGSVPWDPVADLPFLPRVRCGRVILHPATWHVGAEAGPDTLAAWRKRWMVPRYVYLAVGDNRLLLDLDDPRQAEQLHTEIGKQGTGGRVFVQEALPGPEHAWLPGPGGHYIGEFVVPVVLDTAAHAVPARPPRPRSRVVRPAPAPPAEAYLRPPGSEWLYAKLYHPNDNGDELIAGPVRTFCGEMTDRGWADRWFFVRFHDSANHLRLRLHGDPRVLAADVLPELLRWANSLTADRQCERFGLDTYEREIERYGGPAALASAEALFAADSTAVADLLALLRDGADLDRTMLAVRSVDELLAGLGYDESGRVAWCRRRLGFGSDAEQRAVGAQYRRRAGDLRALLAGDDRLLDRPLGTRVREVLARLRTEAAAAAEALAALDARGELGHSMDRLADSFVHMHCNRLLALGGDAELHVVGRLQRTRAGLLHAPVAGAGRALRPPRVPT